MSKHTVMDLDEWPYPKQPLVPLAETVHERMSVEIFRGCTRGCRFCQAGMITRPVRERSITGIGDMVEAGLKATGFEEVGLLSLSSADHSEIADIAKGLADRYEEDKIGLSLPSTRVDAFNIDLANELTRNGRRSGLTFAPEGGSERIRKVINKMVSEEDLIRTVATAYGNGWRQVKLYFMCGLPTETDEDVLQIAEMAKRVIAKGREVTGQNDIRCTVSIGGFVPKPHTPFQWAPQLGVEETDARLEKLRDAIRGDRKYSRNIGFRYHDGKPGIIEGLLSRGDRRVGAVIRAVYEDGGRFDGWREHFSYDRWMRACDTALPAAGLDLSWYTTRERTAEEVLPWDHLDSGLDKDWLWEDWQDALDETEVEDCRWTPVLRLRRLPADGHGDPDRPDGQEAAALDGGQRRGWRQRRFVSEPSGTAPDALPGWSGARRTSEGPGGRWDRLPGMTEFGAVAWPPAPIRTERLVLREPEARDRAAFVELFASPEVGTYVGGSRSRDELERAMPETPGRRPGLFAVEFDGAMIGTVELNRRDAEHRSRVRPDAGEAELGYLFLPRAWGRGYAAEACGAALDWYAGALPGEPVVLTTQTANDRSMRLAAKLGFTEVRRFEEWGAEQWMGVWSSPVPSG